jgi:hypothetical protein
MKKVIVPILFALIFCVQPLFAKTVCLLDGTGGYYTLNGGKEDIKPFEGDFSVPGICHTGLWASIVISAPGVLQITTDSAQDGVCSSVFMVAQTDLAFNGTLTFDNGEDGTVDGTTTVVEVPCSTVPPPKTDGTVKAPEQGSGRPPKN